MKIETALARCVNTENGSYRVEDFGAVGDGTTDDEPAIQAAVDYVASIGGGEVLLGAKTYAVGAQILINIDDDGVVIRGQGENSVLKKTVDANYDVLRVRGRYARLLNFCIDGNKSAMSAYETSNCLFYGKDGLIDGLISRNASRDGVGFPKSEPTNGTPERITIVNSVFEDNARVGVSMAGVLGGIVSNNIIRRNGYEGQTIDQSTKNVIVIGNHFIANNLGHAPTPAVFGVGQCAWNDIDHVIISNNYFQEKATGANKRPAIGNGNYTGFGNSVDVSICGNVFEGSTEGPAIAAIDLSDDFNFGCHRFVISGNAAKNHASLIKLDQYCSDIVIGPNSVDASVALLVDDGGNWKTTNCGVSSSWSMASLTSQPNATGNGTLATVVYDTPIDVNPQQPPTENLGTGEITITLSGIYQLNASVDLSALTGATSGVIEIQKNGVAVARRKFSFPNTTANTTFHISGMERFVTGDVVRVRVSATGKGADTATIAGTPLSTEFQGALIH